MRPRVHSKTYLTLWGCWLLVEAQAEQSWGGARHLGLKLPTQLPVIDTTALASRQDLWRQRGGGGVRSAWGHWTVGQNEHRGSYQVLVEGDMLLWCSNGKDRSGCGRPEVPEGEGGAPSTDLGREVAGSRHCEPWTFSGHAIPPLPSLPSSLSQLPSIQSSAHCGALSTPAKENRHEGI